MCYAKYSRSNFLDKDSVSDLIKYVMKASHVLNGCYGGIGASYLSSDIAISEFMAVKHTYHKLEGRQVRHLIVSFDKGEAVTPELAIIYGYKIANYFENRYQIIFATHTNTNNLHLHFAINTVSFVDGIMFNEGPYGEDNIRKHIEEVTHLKCRWEK